MAALRVAWGEAVTVSGGKRVGRGTDSMRGRLVNLFNLVLEVGPLLVGGAARIGGPIPAQSVDDVSIGDEMEEGFPAFGGREAVLICQDDVIESLCERRKGRTEGRQSMGNETDNAKLTLRKAGEGGSRRAR